MQTILSRVEGRIRYACPCCGSYMGERPPVDQVANALTPRKRLLFEMLLAGGSKGLTVHEALQYLKRKGWHLNRSGLVTHLSILRRAVDPYGWHIARSAGVGGPYRMVPKEVWVDGADRGV